MKKLIPSLVLFAATIVCAATASAEEVSHRPKLTLGEAAIFPVDLDTGKGLPLMSVTSLTLGVPVVRDWVAIAKVAMVTSFDAFKPTPQFQLGAAWQALPELGFGATGIYRLIPHFEGMKGSMHLAGASAGPIIPLGTSGAKIALPMAWLHNLTTSGNAGAVAFELLVPLPI